MKKEEVGLDEAKTQSKDEKDKVVGAVTKAMRQSYANVMQGRNERSAARMNAKIKNNMKEETEQVEEGFGDLVKGVKRVMAGKKNPSDVRDAHLGKSTFSSDPKVKERESRRYDKVQSVLNREEADNLSEEPVESKPSLYQSKMKSLEKQKKTGHDYFGHDAKRQQSGYRGPGQSVLQTAADKAKKVVGVVSKGVKKVFTREELELEQQIDEAFPTVADAKKRMDAGKTATGSVTKTSKGLVHKRDYKDEDESDDMQKKAKGYGARQNFKRSTRVNEQLSFTEMLELYNEHGIKVLAPIETEEMDIDGTTIEVIDGDKINGYVETTVEEVTNDEFTKEYEDQKASFEGKKKQPKVAAGKTTGLKEMPESFQQIDERELSKDEAKKKEDYVKGMKKGLSGFKERYGERAKSVMYGAATNMAKKD
jgi:hypothetical protein